MAATPQHGRSKSLRLFRRTGRKHSNDIKEKSDTMDSTLLAKTIDRPTTVSESIDNYFMKRSSKTSKRTLAEFRADSKNGLPDPQLYAELLAMYRHPSTDFLESNLMVLSDKLLPNLCSHLESGFNVILYGVGSKIRLLQRLQTDYLKRYDCLLIAGYSSSISVRKILNAIVDDVLGLENVPANAGTRLDTIVKCFSKDSAAESPLYLLLNCIDGPNLRSAVSQSVLARLASAPHIHLLATMDNPNLPILWSQVEVSQFNWIWEECTTLLPYENEAAFPNSRLLLRVLRDCNDSGRSGDPLTGLRHIWASITENARDIFRLLVEYQLEEIKSIETVSAQKKSKEKARKGRDEDAAAGPKGMSLEELYWRCRDAFLATSEITLRTQLTEFKDHKFIKFSKDANGTEMVSIPLNQANLVQILENKEVFP